VKLVVTEVEGGVDRLEGLKVNIDLLLLALLCDYCAAVYDLNTQSYLQICEQQHLHN
jgi:hypothetical protein